MKTYDIVIIGCGAAGLAAAGAALVRGRSVAIIDMGERPARKVAASGGGRCNFTNAAAARDRYFGGNPDFVRGALARVTPADILDWAATHKIKPVEKAAGQYFCATGAADVVAALMHDAMAADIFLNTHVTDAIFNDDCFTITGDGHQYRAKSLIVATGGLSFPALGVSDAGYIIAKKFGHKIVPVRPALCAMAVPAFSPELAGISMRAEITVGRNSVCDDMLFTHFGIGGPAAYRASLFDMPGGEMHINLVPDVDAMQWLRDAKQKSGRRTISAVLATRMPTRLAKWIAGDDMRHIADYKDSEITAIANKISNIVIPSNQVKYHGMQSAEVVRGGVSTDAVSSKTMESKLRPGLFFAGEVLDIAGDLGGFNLHWAWASGRIAGQNA